MRHIFYVLFEILVMSTLCFAGDIQTDGKLKSTLASGAPLEVASSDMVVNLNADMVDGVQGTDIYTKAEVDALVAAIASSGRKRFYITDRTTLFAGDSALTACSSGFHMATFFEISEPSSLVYAWDAPNAWIRNDSGVGPPCGEGWVRTGFTSSGQSTPGLGNCALWTSDAQGEFGTDVRLNCDFTNPTGGGSYDQILGTPWVTTVFECSTELQVWCVED